ncbi:MULTISPECIES: hypothetical protein [Cycloclasticus]|uniref:Lipoprotein n=1 Tax=Cycloclasticus pugetii TaxID=34068 RepID=A0AB33Z017_9GAMM|nr:MULTISPECIES: hypothetical protein [Cycloclasticus]ATI02273.1 hypothetical protein CPC19_01990 [Cycloclasticus sp. PY97N]EPD12537.1 hypothetical protein L196_09574 [Cycloclasticus pugetii]
MHKPALTSFIIGLGFLTLLAGCALPKKELVTVPADAFEVCYGYGCKTVQTVTLDDAQWFTIEQLFSPKAASAKIERQQLSLAIAQMETFIGGITHTQDDLPGTFAAFFQDRSHQMDCVDEATNTTLYLRLFRERGLMRFHKEGYRINRGFFLNGWPHTSAVIEQLDSGKRFAVDSWFHKNGIKPEIIPIDLWYSGWHPTPNDDS